MSKKFSEMVPKSTEGWAEYLGISKIDIPTTSAEWSSFLTKAAESRNQEYMANAAMCWLERTGKLSQIDVFATQLQDIRQDLRLSSLQSLLKTWASDLLQ